MSLKIHKPKINSQNNDKTNYRSMAGGEYKQYIY